MAQLNAIFKSWEKMSNFTFLWSCFNQLIYPHSFPRFIPLPFSTHTKTKKNEHYSFYFSFILHLYIEIHAGQKHKKKKCDQKSNEFVLIGSKLKRKEGDREHAFRFNLLPTFFGIFDRTTNTTSAIDLLVL